MNNQEPKGDEERLPAAEDDSRITIDTFMGVDLRVAKVLAAEKIEKSRKLIKIEVDLWPTSNVLMKEHKIRLEVSSSNFPRYDRNPNTGQFIPEATKTVSAKQTVFHSNLLPSH